MWRYGEDDISAVACGAGDTGAALADDVKDVLDGVGPHDVDY